MLTRVVVTFIFLCSLAQAADNANDGNTHDTRDGPAGPDGPETGGSDDDDCRSSSPVLIRSGEFVWSDTDVVLAGRPTLSLSRYYRSFDAREGLFGKGWSTRCEKALIRVLGFAPDGEDGAESTGVPRVEYVHRLANGLRYTFVETAPDVFAAPAGLPGKRLTLDARGAPMISNLDGSTERYDEAGKLVVKTDRNGNATSYEYEGGALARIAAADGRFLSLGYDSRGHVATVTDHVDRVWRYAYGADGTLLSVTDPAGGVRRYAYTDIERTASEQAYPAITSVVDAGGTPVVEVTYEPSGRVASYTEGANTYTYSTRRGFVYKTDSLSAEWGYATDEAGHKSEIYPPISAGSPETYDYDEDGNIVRHVDLAGTEFTREFDDAGRLLSATTPDGTTTIDYVEGTAWPASVTSPTGRTVRFARDGRGNPTTFIDAAGATTSLDWSERGDLLSITNALGETSVRTVNAAGLVTSVTDPLGHTTELAYDARHNLVRATDALGNTTAFEYDVLDRLVATTDALGQRTARTYDPAGRLTSVTNAAGAASTFAYDDFGRTISRSRPDGSQFTYTWRVDNLLETRTDPNGTVVTYDYDRGRRPTGMSAGSTRYRFSHDVLGRVTSATSRGGTLRYTYDAMSRRTSESLGSTTTTWSWNEEGEVVGMSALGEELVYARDARGLVGAFTTPSGTHRYERDALGRTVSHTLPNGASATMSHDAASRLIEQDYTGLGGERYSYAFDALGRVERIGASRSPDRLYTYDAIGRLTSAQHAGSHAYAYDALGNRLDRGGVYDAFDKLLEDDEFAYRYDAAGALTSQVSKTTGAETRYTYGPFRRLTGVRQAAVAGGTPAASMDFTYDAVGRRTSKRTAGQTTTFDWAGPNLIAEYTNNTLTSTYRYDEGYTASEYSDANDTYYVQSDRIDAPRSLSDAAGTAYPVDLTDPYGALVTPASGPGATFAQRFPGQYADRETGLSYNRYRYYEPVAGRYIKDDPIGLRGGPNAYRYASSSPTASIDPWGLADIFIGFEGEFVYVFGLEGGFGIVIDTDSLGQSGVYLTLGVGLGLNEGFGPTVGVFGGDIEGFAVGFDINSPFGSPYGGIGGDGQPYGGVSVPGVPGGHVGLSGTRTLTIGGLLNLVDRLLGPFGPCP